MRSHEVQLKMLLEVSIALDSIVQDKIGSMSLHGKRMMKSVTNVNNAKRAATFSMFLLRTKTDNYVVWR